MRLGNYSGVSGYSGPADASPGGGGGGDLTAQQEIAAIAQGWTGRGLTPGQELAAIALGWPTSRAADVEAVGGVSEHEAGPRRPTVRPGSQPSGRLGAGQAVGPYYTPAHDVAGTSQF